MTEGEVATSPLGRVIEPGTAILIRARVVRVLPNEGSFSVVAWVYDRWDTGFQQVCVPIERVFVDLRQTVAPSIDRLTDGINRRS